MVFLSSFIGSIFQRIRLAQSWLTTPFRSALTQVRFLRTGNPITQALRGFRSIGQRISYFLRIPGRFIKLPTGVSEQLKDTRESLRLPGRERGERKRVKANYTAQFSQIHLTHRASGERTILHIGNITGRSASDITLERGAHKPVRLRFSQVDPQQYSAPILLTVLGGGGALKVDGQTVTRDAPVRNNAIITIDGQEYLCQQFAWDKTPVVTRVEAGWATATGSSREDNEDAIGIYQHKDAYLFAIADGVGGGEAGDRISAFAIQYLLAVFHKNVKYNLSWRDILDTAFRYINAEVRSFLRRSAFPGGTTLTAVVIKGWDATVAHVGDSRLYLLHGSALTQVTTDHAKQVEHVMNTRHTAESNEPPPTRDVLDRAIGKTDTIQPDVLTVRLQPGDRLLLCTDGVSNAITAQEIADLLHSASARQAAETLVRMADERGAPDNASAVAIDVLREPYIEDTWRAEPGDRVFVGYSSLWSLKLRKPRTMDTDYPRPARAGCSLLLVLALVGALLWGGARLLGGTGPAATDTPSPTVATIPPTLTLPATNTPTQPPSVTPSPRPSATPVPTSTQPPTDLPPTSTLRPLSKVALPPESSIVSAGNPQANSQTETL